MQLHIQQGRKGLEKIEHEWNQLFDKLTKPIYSQSFIWHKAYLNNLVVDKNKCYYFCIYKDSNLIAIFPLENIRQKFYLLSFNTLSFSNHPHFGLNSIIVDELENTQIIFEFLYQSLKKEKSIKWDLIYLKRVLNNTQALLCIIKNSKLTQKSIGTPCDIIIVQNYNDTYNKFSKNFRNNIRKRRNKIAKMDKSEFYSSRKTEKLDAYFDHFLSVEASGWKGMDGESSAIKLNKNLKSFYKEIMDEFSNHGQIEINLLMISEIPIAGQFNIIMEPVVFGLKIGYDENYKNLSPGVVLNDHKLQEYGNDQNISVLNLISDSTWHSMWKPEKILSNNIYNCKNLLVAMYLKTFLWFGHSIKRILSK